MSTDPRLEMAKVVLLAILLVGSVATVGFCWVTGRIAAQGTSYVRPIGFGVLALVFGWLTAVIALATNNHFWNVPYPVMRLGLLAWALSCVLGAYLGLLRPVKRQPVLEYDDAPESAELS